MYVEHKFSLNNGIQLKLQAVFHWARTTYLSPSLSTVHPPTRTRWFAISKLLFSAPNYIVSLFFFSKATKIGKNDENRETEEVTHAYFWNLFHLNVHLHMFIGHDRPSSAATMAASLTVVVVAAALNLQTQYTIRHDKLFETIIVFLFSHSADRFSTFVPLFSACFILLLCIKQTIHILFINLWFDLLVCVSLIQFAIVCGRTKSEVQAHG